jgi:RNA polymerase sigma factor (sigma-70 family)
VSEQSPASNSSLSDFLAQLPEEERFILTLHYIHGRSAAEIASALGVPAKPVESMIASGRAKILAAITNI